MFFFFLILNRIILSGEFPNRSNITQILSQLSPIIEMGIQNSLDLFSIILKGYGELFTKVVANYFTRCLHPGYEWVVKFTYFLYSLATTSESPFNFDEVLALKFLLHHHHHHHHSTNIEYTKCYAISNYHSNLVFHKKNQEIVFTKNGRSSNLSEILPPELTTPKSPSLLHMSRNSSRNGARSTTILKMKVELKKPIMKKRINYTSSSSSSQDEDSNTDFFWMLKGNVDLKGMTIGVSSNRWKLSNEESSKSLG